MNKSITTFKVAIDGYGECDECSKWSKDKTEMEKHYRETKHAGFFHLEWGYNIKGYPAEIKETRLKAKGK